TRPAIAFTPSVGVSNLVQPNAEEFPNWANDLLVASLAGNTLFHARTDGDRIAYLEPIRFIPDRLRDIISMRDGRIVMLADTGTLIFIRNAERHANEPREFTVTGRTTLTRPLPDEAPDDDMPAVPRGRQMYSRLCAQCHSLSGEVGIGPPLNGVVERRVGAVRGFGYSPALENYDGDWSESLLQSFLTEPDRHFRGHRMPDPGISWVEVPNVIAFLKTTNGGSTPVESAEEDARAVQSGN
ncbi:MAG: PQQ-dependent sugar dehydrogenase, partial [Hyphomonadaceae bacterium]